MADEITKLRLAADNPIVSAKWLEREEAIAQREREFGPHSLLGHFRVGSVRALNAVPLTRGLENEIIYDVPARLAQALERNELDAALVSVVAALFHDRYDILDGVAVASLGEVKSVFMAHRKPLTELREVFCDPASLSSVTLLKVLLAERGLRPVYRPLENYAAASEKDFVLLIGDPALDFYFANQARPTHEIFDLGTEWLALTNLPFVYAVWALRRGVHTPELRRQLHAARDFGLDTLDHLINSRPEYTRDFRKDYLGWHIHYHLAADEKRGLAKFIELLRKHEFGPIYEPQFIW